MKVLWINPSFLDYRVPVYEELNKILNGNLIIVYAENENRTPLRVSTKIKEKLGVNAIALKDEKNFTIGNTKSNLANKSLNIPYQPNLLKTIMKIDADVIIVEGFFQWSPYAFLKKIFNKTPIVLSYERTKHTERNAPKLRTYYRKLVSKLFINTAIVNGILSKEYTNTLGIKNDKIVVGGMSADSEFFRVENKKLNKKESRKLWNIDNDKLVFVYVGQLIERKGIKELINSWKNIAEYIQRDILLLCAGDGVEKNELSNFIKNNNIINIRLLGSIDYAQLPTLYNAADVFIIPTLEDNWSLVVPEAMATGLPIACSKYNGCWPELVQDNINGKIFDPLDENSIIETIEYFYKNKNILKEMGLESNRIELRYTPKSAAESIYNACKLSIQK